MIGVKQNDRIIREARIIESLDNSANSLVDPVYRCLQLRNMIVQVDIIVCIAGEIRRPQTIGIIRIVSTPEVWGMCFVKANLHIKRRRFDRVTQEIFGCGGTDLDRCPLLFQAAA